MHDDLEQSSPVVRRLRDLPDAAMQPYDWSEFQRRARARAGARGGGGGHAFAAAAVLALALLALWSRLDEVVPGPGPQSLTQHASQPAGEPPAPETAPPAAPTAAMERWLASLPSEPAVVHVGTRAAVNGLEDRIAQVDDLLSAEQLERPQPARLLALQQERARLVGTLVQVRYAETLADEVR